MPRRTSPRGRQTGICRGGFLRDAWGCSTALLLFSDTISGRQGVDFVLPRPNLTLPFILATRQLLCTFSSYLVLILAFWPLLAVLVLTFTQDSMTLGFLEWWCFRFAILVNCLIPPFSWFCTFLKHICNVKLLFECYFNSLSILINYPAQIPPVVFLKMHGIGFFSNTGIFMQPLHPSAYLLLVLPLFPCLSPRLF